MKQREIKSVEYYNLCNICKREIKGKSESQVKYNILVHKRQKHDK